MEELTGKRFVDGFVTLEIMIAMAIMAVSISAVIMLVFGGQYATVSMQGDHETLLKAHNIIESAKVPPFSDGDYFQSLSVKEGFEGMLKISTSRVKWKNGREVNFSAKAFDYESALSRCSPLMAGDWANPKYSAFNTYDLIALATGNYDNGFEISDIKAYKKKLYLSAKATENFKDTFYIFNLPSAPEDMPTYIASLDNAPSIEGINAIALSLNYAYVANAYAGTQGCLPSTGSNCGQMQVLDISDSFHPRVIKNVKIPALSSNILVQAQSIFYNNGYVYLGLEKVSSNSSHGEFNIIDVGGGSGSPLNPILRGTFFVGNGVNDIYVKDEIFDGNIHTRAYIASPNSENVIVLDVSNASNPVKISSFSPPNGPGSNGIGSNHGKRVLFNNNNIYLGRTYGTNELYILKEDETAPDRLLAIGHKNIDGNTASINGLAVRGSNEAKMAFLSTKSHFIIMDVTNPQNINQKASISFREIIEKANNNSDIGGSIQACSRNRLYVGIQTTVKTGTQTKAAAKDVLIVISPGNEY